LPKQSGLRRIEGGEIAIPVKNDHRHSGNHEESRLDLRCAAI